MTWLGGWMREVIMIVLLAIFVDMILPSRSMERYVKLVLSLLILLTLMGPMISLLTDSPANKLNIALLQQESNSGQLKAKNEKTLSQILAQGEQIKHNQQNQSLLWAGEEVARQMKEQLRNKTGNEVQEVKVMLALLPSERDANAQVPTITSVDVTLRPSNPSKQVETREDVNISVAPVEEVKVDVGALLPEEEKAEKEDNQALEATEVSGQEAEGTEDIRKILMTEWNLDAEQIVVQGDPMDDKI
ncbi:stage III sporulation protein AF [Paenibacillus sp. DS2015]|uniref:stage III sporulation protein AF n=1 Tax=Paenibacillus sp. DS2015 TaxID=3373917 RepID=UPI003D1B85AF